jgi:hypothetical protein
MSAGRTRLKSQHFLALLEQTPNKTLLMLRSNDQQIDKDYNLRKMLRKAHIKPVQTWGPKQAHRHFQQEQT